MARLAQVNPIQWLDTVPIEVLFLLYVTKFLKKLLPIVINLKLFKSWLAWCKFIMNLSEIFYKKEKKSNWRYVNLKSLVFTSKVYINMG